LIRYGADVNVCDNDLWTPLHAAATCANLEICKILIDNNADLLAVNTDGNMPYDICDHELCLEYIESEMAKRGVTQQTIDLKRSETEFKMLDDIKQVCYKQIGSYLNNNRSNHAAQSPQYMPSSDATNNKFLLNFSHPFDAHGQLNLNAKDPNGATLVCDPLPISLSLCKKVIRQKLTYGFDNYFCIIGFSIV
jgi:ankyrin repeat protein